MIRIQYNASNLKDPKPKEVEKKSGHWYRLVWIIEEAMNREAETKSGHWYRLVLDDRGRHEQRSTRLNDVFDNFRREIEGATNPWASMLDRRLPRPYAMEEEGTLSRTPLVDMLKMPSKYLANNRKKKQ